MTAAHQPRIVAIGCGNRTAGDDAAGLAIVDGLRSAKPANASVFEMADVGPGCLLEFGERDEIVVLIDAVKTGAPPGTIHCLSLPSQWIEPRNLGRMSTHALGLEHEIALAATYAKCPAPFLLGIEVGNHCRGTEMSASVGAAVHKVITRFGQYCDWVRTLAGVAI